MSQEKLGEAMGVHQSTVAYWENTYTWSPEGEDALKLCAIFGVEVGEFYKVFRTDNREKEDEYIGEDYDDRGDFDDIVYNESPIQCAD